MITPEDIGELKTVRNMMHKECLAIRVSLDEIRNQIRMIDELIDRRKDR